MPLKADTPQLAPMAQPHGKIECTDHLVLYKCISCVAIIYISVCKYNKGCNTCTCRSAYLVLCVSNIPRSLVMDISNSRLILIYIYSWDCWPRREAAASEYNKFRTDVAILKSAMKKDDGNGHLNRKNYID